MMQQWHVLACFGGKNYKYKSEKKGKHKKSFKCHKCGETGHFRRDCTADIKPKQRPVHDGKVASSVDSDVSRDCQDSLDKGIAFAAGNSIGDSVWLMDSGASKHMTAKKEYFASYRQFAQYQHVRIGDGRVLEAHGCGDIQLEMTFDVSDSKYCTMNNVLYVPDLAGNLFSVGAAVQKGLVVQFGKRRCHIRDENGALHGMGSYIGDNLYKLDCKTLTPERAAVAVRDNIDLWHQRLGHINAQQLKQLADHAKGLKVHKSAEMTFCEGCVKGKLHRKPHKSVGEIHSKRRLQLVHSDVCGPITPESLGGNRYFVTFIDDYSRCCKVYFMKHKSDVLDKFKQFEAVFTNECGEGIGRLRTDNGGEYMSKEFDAYLKSKGILHETTVPHTPQQNGVAERKNRTLMESARSMIEHAGLSKRYWAHAIDTAVHIMNRCVTSAIPDGTTPYERWYEEKPDLSHLKVFGCIAYAHVPEARRQKLDSKAEKFRFVGYAGERKGYLLYDEDTQKLAIRHDVVFNEQDLEDVQPTKEKVEAEVDLKSDDEGRQEAAQRPQRERMPPVRFGFDEYADTAGMETHVHYANACNVIEPQTVQEAMSSDDAVQWKAEMDKEYKSLQENSTWELVELPPNRQAVGCKWVFKVKYGHDGKVDRFKSRLVAKGYSQKYGIDYDETFSPVVRFSSIRTLISLAVEKKMLIHQMDVVTAFLNGNLEEEIYMRQPEGYIEAGQEHLVCKLKKSLYGLKQSPRCWNTAFKDFMQEIGYVQSVADPCVFIKKANTLSVVAVYVDDLILLAETEEDMRSLKSKLCARFKMKDIGRLHYCLGITVVHDDDRNCLWIHQRQYIQNIIDKYGLSEGKTVCTPMDANVKLWKDDGVSKPVDTVLYQSIIGSLLYAAIATRPDISQAVGALSKFNSCPTEAHLTAAKRILRYLKGTEDVGLKYQKSGKPLFGYSDADWAGNLDDRRSTSGNVFLMANAGISWLSKKQSTVALSTAESEYIALCMAAQEAVWLKRLFADLGVVQESPICIMEDNQGAIAMTKNPVGHARTKHIDIKYHYVRECVDKGHIDLQYCPSEDMLADIFTKPVPRQKFEKFRSEIGLSKCG